MSTVRNLPSENLSSSEKRVLHRDGGSLRAEEAGMRLRRWVSLIAVAGMLLHAATIARHHVIQFNHVFAAQAASAAEARRTAGICHEESPAQEDGKAQGQSGKSPGGAAKPCPICLGLASAHAVSASEPPVLRVPQAVISLAFAFHDRQAAPPARLRFPPNRGPPSIA